MIYCYHYMASINNMYENQEQYNNQGIDFSMFYDLLDRFPNLFPYIFSLILIISTLNGGEVSAQDELIYVPTKDQLALAERLVIEEGSPALTSTERIFLQKGLFRWTENSFREYMRLRTYCASQNLQTITHPIIGFNAQNAIEQAIILGGSCGYPIGTGEQLDRLNLGALTNQLVMINLGNPESGIDHRFPYARLNRNEIESGASTPVKSYILAEAGDGIERIDNGRMARPDTFRSLMTTEELNETLGYLIENLCLITKHNVQYEITHPTRHQSEVTLLTEDGATLSLTICLIPNPDSKQLAEGDFEPSQANDAITNAMFVNSEKQYIDALENGVLKSFTLTSAEYTAFVAVKVQPGPEQADNLPQLLAFAALVSVLATVTVGIKYRREIMKDIKDRNQLARSEYLTFDAAATDFVDNVFNPLASEEGQDLDTLLNMITIVEKVRRLFSVIPEEVMNDAMEKASKFLHNKNAPLRMLKDIIKDDKLPKRLTDRVRDAVRAVDSDPQSQINSNDLAIELSERYPALRMALSHLIVRAAAPREERPTVTPNVSTKAVKGDRREKENKPEKTPAKVEVVRQEINLQEHINWAVTAFYDITLGEGLDNSQLEQLTTSLRYIYNNTDATDAFVDSISNYIGAGHEIIVSTGGAGEQNEIFQNSRVAQMLIRFKDYVEGMYSGKFQVVSFADIERFSYSAQVYCEKLPYKLAATTKAYIGKFHRAHFGRYTSPQGKTKVVAVFSQDDHK